MKINVKGIEMYLYKGDAIATPYTPTNISNENPAVVTVADASSLTAGMPVTFYDTGIPDLDNNTFVISGVDTGAGTFTALGADLSENTAPLAASPVAEIFGPSERVKLCLSSIEIQPPSVGQIDVSTFCEEGSLPGRATPGQITMGGYLEKDDPGLAEIIAADEDGQERIFLIIMPSGQGYLLGGIALAGLGYQIPLEGAVSFTISGSQTQKIRYLHD